MRIFAELQMRVCKNESEKVKVRGEGELWNMRNFPISFFTFTFFLHL